MRSYQRVNYIGGYDYIAVANVFDSKRPNLYIYIWAVWKVLYKIRKSLRNNLIHINNLERRLKRSWNILNHYEINWSLSILWRPLFVHARGYNYMFFLVFYFLNISAAYIVPYCLLDNRSGIKLLNAAGLTKWLGPIYLTPCEISLNAIFLISIRFFIIFVMYLQCEFLLWFWKSRG